jgi:hypothetical protein
VARAGVVEGAGEVCLLLGQSPTAGLALGQQVPCFLVQTGAGAVFGAQTGEFALCGREASGGVARLREGGSGLFQNGGESGCCGGAG